MKCTYCGKQNPEGARGCGYCGRSLIAPAPPTAPSLPNQQPQQVIIETSSSEGPLSILIGVLNITLMVTALALIAVFVLTFLCVIRLPSDFPVLNLPDQLDDLWSRAVLWQSQNCY